MMQQITLDLKGLGTQMTMVGHVRVLPLLVLRYSTLVRRRRVITQITLVHGDLLGHCLLAVGVLQMDMYPCLGLEDLAALVAGIIARDSLRMTSSQMPCIVSL